MKNLLFAILFHLIAVSNLSSMAVMDTSIVEILDDTLDQIHYYQESFPEPTRLVYPNLKTVSGYVYFQENENLISIDLPNLNSTKDYIVVSNNDELNAFRAPILDTVYNYIFFYENDTLVDFDLCNLGHILPIDEYDIPYFELADNSDFLDNADVCFSEGPPENLTLSDTIIFENEMPLEPIGILSAEANYAENYFTYYLSPDSWDYDDFIIEDDTLKANVTFDYETKEEYNIRIGVFNQLGEQLEKEFVIKIIDVANENFEVVEILDDTLDQIYYHQENFAAPTKLIFPNLTTVLGSAYFHENVNLISVEFPSLNKVNDYFYCYSNEVLESLEAPVLDTVYNYLDIGGNGVMTVLDICNLSHILPAEDNLFDPPYYNIQGNTSVVDMEPQCFSMGPPENLSLSANSVFENSPSGTTIGILSADGLYPVNSFTFYLTDQSLDNEYFEIEEDTLKAKNTFDFEVQNQYEISLGVYNQLGEKLEAMFTIMIDDILDEGIQTVEILDDTLTSIYYHQENFALPTKLVFPNLTTVLEYAYFHENVNLASVDLPLLKYVGDYVYFYGNSVLDTVSCPVIDTIHNYLYASHNNSLMELDVCNLSHIISTDPEEESYYYIESNPVLDFSSTCLEDTQLGFIELDTLQQSSFILAGSFQSNSLDSVSYYIVDDGMEVKETEDFFVDDTGLYLNKDISEYTQDLYSLEMIGFRIDGNPSTTLHERIEFFIDFEIEGKEITSSLEEIDGFKQMRCFPNPTSGKFWLESDSRDVIRLYDSKGRLLRTLSLTQGRNEIDVSNLDSGYFFIKTISGARASIIKF